MEIDMGVITFADCPPLVLFPPIPLVLVYCSLRAHTG